MLFHEQDRTELDFSLEKGGRFVDRETVEMIAADPRTLASTYKKAFDVFLEQYRKPCAEMMIDYRLVKTSEDTGLFVRSFLEERKRFSK